MNPAGAGVVVEGEQVLQVTTQPVGGRRSGGPVFVEGRGGESMVPVLRVTHLGGHARRPRPDRRRESVQDVCDCLERAALFGLGDDVEERGREPGCPVPDGDDRGPLTRMAESKGDWPESRSTPGRRR